MDLYRKTSTQEEHDLRFHVKLAEKSFELHVIVNHQAYFAQVPESEIDHYAKLHHLDFTPYYTNLKKYLHEPSNEVAFSFKNDQFFVLRKGLVTSKYFIVQVTNIEYTSCVEQLLDETQEKYQTAATKLGELETANEKLQKELDEHDELIKQIVDKGKSDEEQLYVCFNLLLNEKKRIIQELKGKLRALDGSGDKAEKGGKVDGAKKGVAETKTPSTSRVEETGDDDTDEESPTPSKKLRSDCPADAFAQALEKSPSPPPVPKRITVSKSKSAVAAEEHVKKVEEETSFITPSLPMDEPDDIKVEESNTEIVRGDEDGEHSKAMEYNTQDLLDRL